MYNAYKYGDINNACKCGDIDTLRHYIILGASLFKVDKEKYSLLRLALIYENYDIILLLIQNGLDWNHVIREPQIISYKVSNATTVTYRIDKNYEKNLCEELRSRYNIGALVFREKIIGELGFLFPEVLETLVSEYIV